jgi:hypothetical protein
MSHEGSGIERDTGHCPFWGSDPTDWDTELCSHLIAAFGDRFDGDRGIDGRACYILKSGRLQVAGAGARLGSYEPPLLIGRRFDRECSSRRDGSHAGRQISLCQ